MAGVLLCTQSPEQWLPNAAIAATLYRGIDRTSGHIDSHDIAGPLSRQVSHAMVFVARNMRIAARKEPARMDLPQYSERAVFEAIVNAVAHRDYSKRGSRVRLSMFADRLEVQSPGSLPDGMTLESMATRQETRNDALTSVLARMPVGAIRGSEGRQHMMARLGGEFRPYCAKPRNSRAGTPAIALSTARKCSLSSPRRRWSAAPHEPPSRRRTPAIPIPRFDVLALFPSRTWQRGDGAHSRSAGRIGALGIPACPCTMS